MVLVVEPLAARSRRDRKQEPLRAKDWHRFSCNNCTPVSGQVLKLPGGFYVTNPQWNADYPEPRLRSLNDVAAAGGLQRPCDKLSCPGRGHSLSEGPAVLPPGRVCLARHVQARRSILQSGVPTPRLSDIPRLLRPQQRRGARRPKPNVEGAAGLLANAHVGGSFGGSWMCIFVPPGAPYCQ